MVLGQIFRQIVPIRVMTLINSNVVASRHIKREEILVPVAVRHSETPELNFNSVFTVQLVLFLKTRRRSLSQSVCLAMDVTNIRNGDPVTGNGEPGTGVLELIFSGNQLDNSKWRTTQKKSVSNGFSKIWCDT